MPPQLRQNMLQQPGGARGDEGLFAFYLASAAGFLTACPAADPPLCRASSATCFMPFKRSGTESHVSKLNISRQATALSTDVLLKFYQTQTLH